MSLAPDIRAGYRLARRVAQAHGKSFYFASAALFGERRRAAYALYAFCRRLDDMVDLPSGGDLLDRLIAARSLVRRIYTASTASLVEGPFQPQEMLALRHTIERFQIPEDPFHELIAGMEMDLVQSVYESWKELDLYCYRVAGVVGLMLSPVLGGVDPRATAPAVDLGKAMQLTNILRDLGEDVGRARLYLPLEDLDRFGVRPLQIVSGRVDARFVELMRFEIERARALYTSAERGLPTLTAFGAQRTVRLMATIYGGILDQIERQDYDVFSARARVSLARKVGAMARVLLAPHRTWPVEPQSPAPRLPAVGSLS